MSNRNDSNSSISPLSVVDPSATLGVGVQIGPFCYVGPDVVLGDGCRLISHVSIRGKTVIGRKNVLYQNVVIGAAPQDLKYNGAPTKTIIGDANVFRENVTVHRGTELGGGATVIGSHNLIMVGSHVAHDCILEDNILLANQVHLAGHVQIGTGAVVSAMVGMHHFVRMGRFSYVGGMTPVRRDVPPFVKFSGDPNEVRGVNEEGMKRSRFSAADIEAVKQAYRVLYRKEKNITAGLAAMKEQGELNEHAAYLVEFVEQSCENRFGRYLESFRQDSAEQRNRRDPDEVREKE